MMGALGDCIDGRLVEGGSLWVADRLAWELVG